MPCKDCRQWSEERFNPKHYGTCFMADSISPGDDPRGSMAAVTGEDCPSLLTREDFECNQHIPKE